MDLVIDIVLLGILGITTYLVAVDGPWNAILAFFSVIFGGLLAMNFFEPLAGLIAAQSRDMADRADFISLVGLFALFVFLIRLGLEQVAPSNIELPDLAYKIGSWGFGFATAYVTVAVLCTSLHTAPMPRKFLGFAPERKNLIGITAPDIQWLAFTQHVTENVFARRYAIINENKETETTYRNFDGLRVMFPSRHVSEYLPTFVIRYASRRQRIEGRPAMVAPPVVPASSTGAPAPGPAF